MTQMTRRSVLAGTAAAAAASVALPGIAHAKTRGRTDDAVLEIEDQYDRLIGLYARNLRTGREVSHRADERFVMCSPFKTLAVAAVLDGRVVTPDREPLRRSAHWPPSLVTGARYAVRFQEWQDAGYVPTVAEVCEVTLCDSDNAGGNWLLQHIGGPAAITRLALSLGDRFTNLTRWEPDLNTWSPGQVDDTTTPRAIGRSYVRLMIGDALPARERHRLVTWMRGNRTGNETLRKGLPDGWTAAEKTGTGEYGTRNDVGIVWTPDGTPVLISCLTRGTTADATALNSPLAAAAELCARRLE